MGKGRIQGDLLDRSLEFAVATTTVVGSMPDGTIGWTIGRQLLRASTSIGANLREADHALTDAEFINRCSIARKESSETQYWLELCQRTGILSETYVDPLRREADELMRILTTIVKRSQNRLNSDARAQ